MSVVNELVKEIKDGLTQTSCSQKDEQRFMKAMLNDKEYQADIYSKGEVVGQVCPSAEARQFLATAISATTKMPQAEATALADAHEFKNSEANNMITVSKCFLEGYLDTGRKMQLNSGIGLSQKHVEATERPYPKRIGVDEQGNAIYGNGISQVPAHDTIRVHNVKY